MYLGIDIGSTSSKAVVLNEEGSIVSMAVYHSGTGTKGPLKAVNEALATAEITEEDVRYTVVTGYGRITYEKADRQITEITCHCRGVTHLLPEARTIIDIGGQDSKVIQVDRDGRVENFMMNDKCAAGTGRFLEVMARILDCPIEELADLDASVEEGIAISSTCTVFAESEVISHLSKGATREAVAKGIHASVAKRVAGLALRVGVRPIVVMTGGVAMNAGVVSAMARELDTQVAVVDHPQLTGAIGAALYAREYANAEREGKETV